MAIQISNSIFLISAIVFAISIAILIKNKNSLGIILGLGILSSCIGIFAYGKEIQSTLLHEKFNWIVVRYFTHSIFVITIPLAILYYLRIHVRARVILVVLFSIIPISAVVLLLLHDVTGLMYGNIRLESSDGILFLAKTPGVFYWVNQIFLMVLLFFGAIAIGLRARNGSALMKKQSIYIVTGVLIPLAANFVYLIGIRPLGFINSSVFSFFPSAVMIWYGIQRYQFTRIRPIARDILLDKMQDGMLVIDENTHVIDINPAAQTFFQIKAGDVLGKPIREVAPDLARHLAECEPVQVERRIITLNDKSVQVSNSLIRVHGDEHAGNLIVIRDMQDRIEAERLKEAEIERQIGWQERRKIARTLHDSIIQYLNSLTLLTGSAMQRVNQSRYDQLPEILSNIETSSRRAASDLRELIQKLQIESTSDQAFDLINALIERIAWIESQKTIEINLVKPVSIPLTSSQQQEIFFILLEALNNIIQHSEADKVAIRLKNSGEIFSMEIVDNGKGFNPKKTRPGGMGLSNIKERSHLLAGLVSIRSAQGEGTTICVDVPTKIGARL